MALTDESNGFYMPVAPAYGGGYGNGGGFGMDSWWGILLLIALLNGGFGFGGFGGMGGMMGLGFDFPWLLNGQQQISNNTNNGFRDAQINDNINSVRDSIAALATQLCSCCGDLQMAIANSTSGIQMALANGFSGTTAAINGAQNAISQQLYNNEIASLNRSFAEQTANAQGFNAVNSGIADTRYTIATEACATRTTDTQNAQSIITALTAGVQSIKDQLCEYRNDAKNDEISQLRQEVLFARGQASQTAQNADIINGVYSRLSQCPVNSVPVFGNQPIFTCPTNVGMNNCGCGCGVA